MLLYDFALLILFPCGILTEISGNSEKEAVFGMENTTISDIEKQIESGIEKPVVLETQRASEARTQSASEIGNPKDPGEDERMKAVKDYIHLQQKKLVELKEILKRAQEENALAFKNISAYVENPLNVYFSVRRMYYDWARVKELLQEDDAKPVLDLFAKNRIDAKEK